MPDYSFTSAEFFGAYGISDYMFTCSITAPDEQAALAWGIEVAHRYDQLYALMPSGVRMKKTAIAGKSWVKLMPENDARKESPMHCEVGQMPEFSPPDRPPHLAFSTGNPAIDSRIIEFLNEIEWCFRDKLRAAYLTGSWRDGSAVSRSDVDIVVIFRGLASENDVRDFNHYVTEFNAIDEIEIGPLPMDDEELNRPIPAYLKEAALLRGEDVLKDLPQLSDGQAMRRWALGSLRLMQMLRGSAERLGAPLSAPDPQHPHLGYDLRRGGAAPSTKLLVSAIARMAGARAAHAGHQMPSKKACFERYREIVGDGHSDFVEEAFKVLKIDWAYGIPDSPQEAETLRRLCASYLQLENDFLAHVADWVGQAQASDNLEELAWAEKCLDRASLA